MPTMGKCRAATASSSAIVIAARCFATAVVSQKGRPASLVR